MPPIENPRGAYSAIYPSLKTLSSAIGNSTSWRGAVLTVPLARQTAFTDRLHLRRVMV